MVSDLKQYVVVYAPSDRAYLPMVLKDKPDYLKGVLNLPGGKIEEGESVVKAAVRELQEETGLKLRRLPLVMGCIRGTKSEIHVIKCEVEQAPLVPSETETEKFDWYNLFDVHKQPKLMPNLRLVLPLCSSGATGWTIFDMIGNWRGLYHLVQLELMTGQPLDVRVPGMSYYEEKTPCTTQVTL